MKRNTIKWKILKYNIIVIIVLVALTTLVFNLAIRFYIKSDVTKQLAAIASRAEETALHKGPDFFPPIDAKNPPPPRGMQRAGFQNPNDLFMFYFMLDRSLREPLSVLNADYVLLDSKKKPVTPPDGDYFKPSNVVLNKIASEIPDTENAGNEQYMSFTLSGTEYVAIAKPVSGKNTFGLGWIIVYSSLQKLNQLQLVINVMLFIILIISALIITVFSSNAAKKISAPFSSLNQHLGKIAERNFGVKIHMPVDDELQEFVNNINTMSEKLETYDKAQKTFLQNASHEFRTPLMSIQSYAEGIRYDVVDHTMASEVIINETKRMTHLVEDLLYLSRLDSMEENYHFSNYDFNEFINACIERIDGIAMKNNIQIAVDALNEKVEFCIDEEKLSRAMTNIINNCIRYAKSTVTVASRITGSNRIAIDISDDGPGFDPAELPNIFDRFYKGKNGNFGLGLAISRNVIEKHNGNISAGNSGSGALFKIDLPIK